MSVSPAQVLRQFLNLSLVCGDLVRDWPSFAGANAADMPRSVGLMDSGAYLQGRDARTGEELEKPTVSVLVRAPDALKARAKSYEIVTAVRPLGVFNVGVGWGQALPIVVEGEDWALQSVKMMTAPTPIGVEKDNRRVVYSINFKLSLTKVTAENLNYLWPVGGYG